MIIFACGFEQAANSVGNNSKKFTGTLETPKQVTIQYMQWLQYAALLSDDKNHATLCNGYRKEQL